MTDFDAECRKRLQHFIDAVRAPCACSVISITDVVAALAHIDELAQVIRRLTDDRDSWKADCLLVKAEAEKWHRLFQEADAAKIVMRMRAEKAEAEVKRLREER